MECGTVDKGGLLYLNLSQVDGQGWVGWEDPVKVLRTRGILSVCQMNLAKGACLGLVISPLNPASG